MNRLPRCSLPKNYRYMIVFAITPRTQYMTFYLTLKAVAGKMAFAFYDSTYAANTSLCTGLIFPFISRNIFPYFHLYHLEIRQATKNAAHRYYLINSELIFRSEIVCLRYMFSPECYPKSCEEIVVIVKVCGEVIRCRRSAAKRFAVPDFLDITQTAGDTAVAV